jgi:4-hydroxy-tetrahydrodipicolinate reductase
MMNFGLVGFSGKMGKVINETFAERDYRMVLKVDGSTRSVDGIPKVIIDFSRPEALPQTIDLCVRYSSPLVIGTTGLDEDEFKKLKELSKVVPIVQSYNFSIGITLMIKMLEEFSSKLSDWDVEIVETHHVHKKDSPSGTAIMLRNAIKNDVKIHSIRIGGIPGDHAVIFANDGEVFEISHRAISRRAFSLGVLRASEWIIDKKPDFYKFSDVIYG